MRSFFLALAITGIQAQTCPYTATPTTYLDLSGNCDVLLAAVPPMATDIDSCNAMPFLAVALYSSRNYEWQAYPVVTGDGYVLHMGRIMANGSGVSNWDVDAGPILFLHGAYGDGLSWFGGSDPSYDSLFESLYDFQGHDVWIAFQRGTQSSNLHVDDTFQARSDGTTTGQEYYENYWNFGIDEIATYDIPEMINIIVSERHAQGLAPSKVQIITATTAVQEALLTLSKFPTTSSDLIATVINQSPCLIQNESVSMEFFAALGPAGLRDLAADGEEREGRSLKRTETDKEGRRLSHEPKRDKSASKKELYSELRRMRGLFSYSDYQNFYYCYQDWR